MKALNSNKESEIDLFTRCRASSFIGTVAKGFCMGAADVVPGVSGGTMAVILGIYQRLVEAIRAFDLAFLKLLKAGQLRSASRHADLGFLLPLGIGIASALLFFTRVVPLPTFIRTHPVPVYSLFFGLIVASIIVLLLSFKNFRSIDGVALLSGCIIGFGVVNLVPTATPETAWFVFLSGALAICAMILPGISGSFLLLILQKYAYIFDAVGRLDFAVLLPFGLGAATGLLLFSRVLTWLLRSYYRVTLHTIVGLLIGSLWVIWPFQERVELLVRGKPRAVSSAPYLPDGFHADVLWALAFAAAGLVTVFLLHRMGAARAAQARGEKPG
jgi:putative membrane protein